jgi:hypothetical protein
VGDVQVVFEEDGMNQQARTWRRSWPAVATLALAVVVAPLPVAAAEAQPAAKPVKGLMASAEKAAAAAAVEAAAAPNMAQASGTDLGSSSFFKTKAGAIALVLVAAGLGYTIYSTSNDRVKSPGKK